MAGAEIDNTIIDNLDDFDEAIKWMNDLGLDSDDIGDVSDAQHQLRLYLAGRNKEQQRAERARGGGGGRAGGAGGAEGIQNDVYQITASNSTRLVQHLMDENRTSRKQLQQLVLACRAMVERLPETRRIDLAAVYPNALVDLNRIVEELELNECVILVAGETGAGKSTMLNLLLGELAAELLPVAHLSSTSAITELRYCPYGKMVVHYRDPSEETKTFDLSPGTAAKTIAKQVHQRDDRGSATLDSRKVEVHWPCEWLRGGITIVDSPGVGEDPELTELVKQYLPKAFGFIYVINTPNAGGIDPDRLQDLMFSHLAKQKEGLTGQFNPRSAVFVCNKWDDVPPDQKQSVREYVMTQLHKVWPGFTEEQVFFMSATQAIKQLSDQLVANDYLSLLHGIERLIPVGLNNRLAQQYSVAWKMMDRCRLILKAFIFEGEVEADSVRQKVKDGRHRLDHLAKQPKILEDKLNKQMGLGVLAAKKSLSNYLRDPETRHRLSTWSRRDCQVMLNSNKIDSLHDKMVAKVMKRIKNEINDWDTEKQIFQKMRDRLVKVFKDEFHSIEEELKNIEHRFTSDEPDMQGIIDDMRQQNDEVESLDLDLNLKEKLILGFTAPIWVPIGLVVGLFALPVAGIKALHKRRKQAHQLKKVKDNIEISMAKLTNELLDDMTTSEKLKEALQEKVNELMRTFKQLLDEIPRLIDADRQILDKMEHEIADRAQQLAATYKPLYGDIGDLLAMMNCLYLRSIRAYDVDINDLSDYNYLGEGQFARVYTAQWTRNNSQPPLTVAVKAMKEPVDEDNATDIMVEEDNLRRLGSGNVVRYYGTGVSHVEQNTFPLFVMEFCAGTLADRVYDPSYRAPANNKGDMRLAANYACQVSAGLAKIHKYGYLHRDLKPENILVDTAGVVKIGDLGLAKKTAEVTGTLVGTPLYMAPEVFLGAVYNEKADMFSFGMLLWELWYGKCVIEVYQVDNFREFMSNPFPYNLKPDGKFKEVMKRCWNDDPKQRPSATECYHIIHRQYIQQTTRAK